MVNLGQEVSIGMLAEQVDHVIGVDTHRDTHAAAIVAAGTGAAGRRGRSERTRAAIGSFCGSRS
jgi:hypothetical protein